MYLQKENIMPNTIKFTKMQGIGNDYIYINLFESAPFDFEKYAVLMSPRHFSVGSDGIITIGPSMCADAEMRIFNADGSEGKMCGNGIRCVGKFLYDRGIVKKDIITVETKSGIKTLYLHIKDGKTDSVTVDMGKAILKPCDIPMKKDGDSAIKYPIIIDGKEYKATCVSMGNPHCVIFGGDPDEIEIEKTGPKFENDPLFPERVNTEFAKIIDKNTVKMRVWERGSGETYACGTGACATAVAAVLEGYCEKDTDITVKLVGGDLIIKYTDKTVYMTGKCEFVYDGEYFID